MAKYVVCRDKEEAMAAARAGVLYVDCSSKSVAQYVLHPDPAWVDMVYDDHIWPRETFVIQVEDEDGNG